MTQIDIALEHPEWAGALNNAENICKTAIETALSYIPALKNRELEVSLVLTDNKHIQKLNKTYRFKDKPTNVLSFPQIDWTGSLPGNAVLALGDIILAFETVSREAQDQGKTFEHHLQHLLVHGTLHLCGYDHEDDEEAEAMESLEAEILQGLGIKNPYLAA